MRSSINSNPLPAEYVIKSRSLTAFHAAELTTLFAGSAIILIALSWRTILAQPTDEPKVSILPEPELNPLLNPLLGAHMGRWAEVYFTNPPEKRAQAVSELVRELANHPATREVPTQLSDNDRVQEGVQLSELVRELANHPTTREVPTQPSDNEPVQEGVPEQTRQVESRTSFAEEASVVCGACGHRNLDAHRFCGMCGVPLAAFPNAEPEQDAAEPAPFAATDWDEPEVPSGDRANPHRLESASDFVFRDQDDQANDGPPLSWRHERPAELHMLSQYQPEPVSHNYRVYFGAAVAILLALLVYVTWRSNTIFWSSGKAPAALPQAVPSSSDDTQGATPAQSEQHMSAPQNSENSSPPNHGARKHAGLTRGETAPPSQNQNQLGATADNNGEVNAGRSQTGPPARPLPVTASPPASAAWQGGSEELSTAEKYLNAGPGTARDSRQAAAWLWKAVAKKNLAATMLLSDLYLRGDGVTKSCDQARLLLDAAARKGVPGAGERLRNLPAFGCQ